METYFGRTGIEERIINILLGKNPNEYKGTYIDIGAGNPVINSNTYYYYLRGWKGLLVEPRSSYGKRIREDRPNDIYEQIALMNYNGTVKMYQNASDRSPLSNKLKKKYKNFYITNCMTMDALLEKYPNFKEPDFISIDIDTGEENMLKRCNFKIFKPKVMCIEYTDSKGRIDYRQKWEHFFIKYYDVRHIEKWDVYYIRKGYERRNENNRESY